jgi:hypothetical protein
VPSRPPSVDTTVVSTPDSTPPSRPPEAAELGSTLVMPFDPSRQAIVDVDAEPEEAVADGVAVLPPPPPPPTTTVVPPPEADGCAEGPPVGADPPPAPVLVFPVGRVLFPSPLP